MVVACSLDLQQHSPDDASSLHPEFPRISGGRFFDVEIRFGEHFAIVVCVDSRYYFVSDPRLPPGDRRHPPIACCVNQCWVLNQFGLVVMWRERDGAGLTKTRQYYAWSSRFCYSSQLGDVTVVNSTSSLGLCISDN